MVEAALALEVEYGVHDVLEGPWARDAPVLGDVAHEQHGGPRFLGEPHESRGALAHLANVAGRALQRLGVAGLDRVQEQHARAERRRVMQDGLEPGFAEHVHLAGVVREAIGAETQLLGGFLARHVQRRDAGALEAGGALQQQRRFPDPRLAADQDDRSGDHAPAEHEVELGEARPPPPYPAPFYGGQADGRSAGQITGPPDRPTAWPPRGLFNQGVPGPTRVAAPAPFGLLRTALAAPEHRASLSCHGSPQAGRRAASSCRSGCTPS